ncbi:cobyric acid synthase [Shewanella maritima]|uniref:cobyric acid synthase n=1 Tax=Shewanella maritima TaxID=2520507 RepID=UPI0037361E97
MSQLSLMIQGTTSDAGKSVLVAGLCRVLARKGIKVAPFKPQNMALNSAVTVESGEIGRAQAVQAQACNLPPSNDMNPVLIKPNTDIGAQIIIQGQAKHDMDAVTYHEFKPKLLELVIESFNRLGQQVDAQIIEGAGSPAEINLREYDIANMGFALPTQTPVIIVADIDRGGVFAHLYGTFDLLSDAEKQLVKGFVINRFRGDITLLHSGLDWLTEKTGVPVIGVIPYLHGLYLESEDGVSQQQVDDKANFTVVVPVLSRISNHTDFDALRLNPAINIHFIGPGNPLPPADLIIIPGSKCVRDDLAMLKQQGWDKQIAKHLRYHGKVIGICGGYQMLGQTISDPQGIESQAGSSDGLGYLNISTTITAQKTLKHVSGTLTLNHTSSPISGYEIHAGITDSNETTPINIDGKLEGAISECNQIFGTYLHGLFDDSQACDALLKWAGVGHSQAKDIHQVREDNLNRLADCLEQSLDLDSVFNSLPQWQNG